MLRNLRWVAKHRAWTPNYLIRYWRFFWFKLRNPHIITTGFVFIGKNVTIEARKGYGRLTLGRWIHFGEGTTIRCHEGAMVIGDKTVFGTEVKVNGYLDVEIGAKCIIADWVYICDFDHRTEDIFMPIKDQGIVKSPVRIGPDVWIGTKASVLKGTRVGEGSVLGAHSVTKGSVEPFSVMAGVPARKLKDRREAYAEQQAHRDKVARIASETAAAVAEIREKLPRGNLAENFHPSKGAP